MDVSLGLAQCVAASTALLLPRASQGARGGEPVYALAEGRFLLRVQLAGGGRVASPPPRSWSQPAQEYVAPGWVALDSPAVRLLPSARRRIQQAKDNVVGGFEQPLVRRSATAMVASGLLSFALSALTYGFGSNDAAALPSMQEPKRGSEVRYEDPGKWQLRFLVADVGAPAPHSFRKQTNSHTNSAPGPHSNNAQNTGHSNFIAHSNIVNTGSHVNTPYVAPTNVPAVHTNTLVP